MSEFAVIETGGKQYKVSVGDKIKIEKLKAGVGDDFSFDKVLLFVSGDKVEVGKPYLPVKVSSKIKDQIRDEKKIIFKYSSKSRTRRRKGHRQHQTIAEITSIK